jgi:hypothetical protein
MAESPEPVTDFWLDVMYHPETGIMVPWDRTNIQRWKELYKRPLTVDEEQFRSDRVAELNDYNDHVLALMRQVTVRGVEYLGRLSMVLRGIVKCR